MVWDSINFENVVPLMTRLCESALKSSRLRSPSLVCWRRRCGLDWDWDWDWEKSVRNWMSCIFVSVSSEISVSLCACINVSLYGSLCVSLCLYLSVSVCLPLCVLYLWPYISLISSHLLASHTSHLSHSIVSVTLYCVLESLWNCLRSIPLIISNPAQLPSGTLGEPTTPISSAWSGWGNMNNTSPEVGLELCEESASRLRASRALNSALLERERERERCLNLRRMRVVCASDSALLAGGNVKMVLSSPWLLHWPETD